LIPYYINRNKYPIDVSGSTYRKTNIEKIVDLQLDKNANDQLKAKKGSPALTVTRHYVNKNGKVFVVGIATHPAERYTYSFYLKRGELFKK
jgi:DNA-binding GntR family transcriptional regulator